MASNRLWHFGTRTALLTLGFTTAVLVTRTAGAVPGGVVYRGTLEDGDGPFTGAIDMVFELCDAPTGGNCPWSEGQTVNVQDGLFSTTLGASTPIPDSLLINTPVLYLGISVGGTPLSGRQRLQATAFSRGAGWAARSLDAVPIGTIVAWHKDLTATVPALPANWVECNGQQIDDDQSPYHLEAVPDLNGAARFLRGGNSSGILESDQLQSHTHVDTGHDHDFYRPRYFAIEPTTGVYMYFPGAGSADAFRSTTLEGNAQLGDPTSSTGGTPRHGSETRPVNMSVVWIIKVK